MIYRAHFPDPGTGQGLIVSAVDAPAGGLTVSVEPALAHQPLSSWGESLQALVENVIFPTISRLEVFLGARGVDQSALEFEAI